MKTWLISQGTEASALKTRNKDGTFFFPLSKCLLILHKALAESILTGAVKPTQDDIAAIIQSVSYFIIFMPSHLADFDYSARKRAESLISRLHGCILICIDFLTTESRLVNDYSRLGTTF